MLILELNKKLLAAKQDMQFKNILSFAIIKCAICFNTDVGYLVVIDLNYYYFCVLLDSLFMEEEQ